jgi:hypothetical protein
MEFVCALFIARSCFMLDAMSGWTASGPIARGQVLQSSVCTGMVNTGPVDRTGVLSLQQIPVHRVLVLCST